MAGEGGRSAADKKEKGLNGEIQSEGQSRLKKFQWEKAEKVYDGKREAVLTGYYQEKKEENRVTVEVQLEGSNVKTYTEADYSESDQTASKL